MSLFISAIRTYPKLTVILGKLFVDPTHNIEHVTLFHAIIVRSVSVPLLLMLLLPSTKLNSTAYAKTITDFYVVSISISILI